MSSKMFDMIFNLKFQSKELNRNAKKAEKNEKLEKDKAFKAMQKNNMEGARIHAANAIRCHNENLQFLRIASQLEGTVSKLEAQMSMLAMNKNIGVLTKQLQKTLSKNELTKAAKVMEDFDTALENLELQGNNMSSVMTQQTAQATPEGQVQDLLDQIADGQGMQLKQDLPGAPAKLVEKQEEDSMEARMKNLQG